MQSLRHRLDDVPDWWTLPEDEIDELNRGNLALLHLLTDGAYTIHIHDSLENPDIRLLLRVPSGDVFIGAAEDTTGGDLEPDHSDAVFGKHLSLPPGCYTLEVGHQDQNIQLAFIRESEEGKMMAEQQELLNSFTEQLRL